VDIKPRILKKYVSSNGRCPYDEWFDGLKDVKTRAIIDARLIRIRNGNFGTVKSVGRGVMELKISFGPGYRVYFSEEADSIIILLCGGDKRTQKRDIKNAQDYWEDYKRR
jgi:putative addiction module killer protein